MSGTAAEAGGGGALCAFRRFVLLHGCVRGWLWVHFAVDLSLPVLAVCAALSTLAFAAVWHSRTEALAPRLALPGLIAQLLVTFPQTDNHFFLELYAVTLLCVVGSKEDGRALALQGLRALTAIVLFQTGLQKLLYGHYFDGAFLAFMIGQGDRFAAPFEWWVSASEVARLRGYDALLTGQGPFRLDSLAFAAVSNTVWIAEIGLAVLLAFARTRLFAAFAALAMVAAIQLGAREFGFALLFTNLLLLFSARGNARALPVFVALYVYALAAVWLGLPGAQWLPAGSL